MKANLVKLTCGLALLGAAAMVQAQTYTTLDDPLGVNGAATIAFGISGNNIVGSYTAGSGNTYGFLYNGSTFTALNDPSAAYGTFAYGVSGNIIAGTYTDSSGNDDGFLYNGGTYTTLDDPNGINTIAFGISGTTIVGTYTDSSDYNDGFIVSVPEPSTLVLAGLGGLAGLLFRHRK